MNTPPLIICGMHRSGTSLAAGLLSACGLDVGPESLLMLRQDDNPTGFHENHEIVNMHEDALVRAGFGWDAPPPAEPAPAWDRSVALAEDARMTASRYQGHDTWGFKDPRASLFMGFWRSLFPGVRFLVCLRNPLDVALSLQRRSGSSITSGLALWQRYYEHIERDFDPARDMAVHFDVLRNDPQGELTRLLQGFGLEASPDQIREALAMIRPASADSGYSLLAARAHGLSERGADLYSRFLERSGPGCAALVAREPLAALGAGFEVVKDQRAWMGRQGIILVDGSKTSGTLVLSFNARSTLLGSAPTGQLSLNISLDGHGETSVTVTGDRAEQILLGLPQTGQRTLTLTLRSSFASSPCAAGISPDLRILSVNVGGLQVVEQPIAPLQK